MMPNQSTAYDNYPYGYGEARSKFSRTFMEMFDALIAKVTPGVGTFLLKFIAVGFVSEWAYKNMRANLYQSLTTIALNNKRVKCIDYPQCIYALGHNVLHLYDLSKMPLDALEIITRPQVLEDIIKDHKQVTNKRKELNYQLVNLRSQLNKLNQQSVELSVQKPASSARISKMDKISSEIQKINNKLAQLKTLMEKIQAESYNIDAINNILLKKHKAIKPELAEHSLLYAHTKEKVAPDASVPLSDKGNYLQSLATLKTLLPLIKNSKITIKTTELIQQIEHLKQNNQPIILLTQALDNTNFLLKGLMEPRDYHKFATKISGYPSPGMKALGIVMQLLGALISLTGLILVASGISVVPGIALSVAGATTIAVGSFFNKAKGVSKTLIDLSNDVEAHALSLLEKDTRHTM